MKAWALLRHKPIFTVQSTNKTYSIAVKVEIEAAVAANESNLRFPVNSGKKQLICGKVLKSEIIFAIIFLF